MQNPVDIAEQRVLFGEVAVRDRTSVIALRDGRSTRPKRTWPRLGTLRLSEREQRLRRRGIGGSDANVILCGERNRILELWREKRGEVPAPDLSAKLAVALGAWTESFNRQWFEQVSGHEVSRIGRSAVCPRNAWRRCTLDGYVEASGAVWEAKHTSAFSTSDQVLERYMPQLQHNMAVVGAERAVLSVIFGNHKYEIIEVGADWLYQQELFEAERHFWHCVSTGMEPVAAEPPPVPRPIGVREVCFDGNNAWAAAAADWINHREAARTHAAAAGLLKSLVDEDVGRAFGHGVEAKRSKSGAITVRELA